MPKFATVGTIEVALGRRDQLLPLLVAHKARCLKDEPGTLHFEILLPKDDDTKGSYTKSTETTPHLRCIGTGRPSHDGERRPPVWW
jgi:hypothetical protein